MESGARQAWRSELFETDLVKMEEIQRLEEGGGDRRIFFLGGEHKHTYDSRLRGIVPRSLTSRHTSER